MTTKFKAAVLPVLKHEGGRSISRRGSREDVVLYAHITNNVIFYIGIGYEHRAYSRNRSSLWSNHVSKYGEHRVVILLRDLGWTEACFIEKEFIRTLGKKCNKSGDLVNMTNGGEGTRGLKHSEARNKHMSELLKGRPCSEEQKQQISRTLKGRKLTEEHKINIGLGGKGRVFSEKHLHNLQVKCAKRKTLLCKLYKVKVDIINGVLTRSEIYTKYGIGSSVYYKVFKMFNIQGSPKVLKSRLKKSEVRYMLHQGFSVTYIVEKLDISESTVCKLKRQLKL